MKSVLKYLFLCPEPPHSVENIGQDIFELYRIEYKEKMTADQK